MFRKFFRFSILHTFSTEEDTSNNGGTESETELIYRNYEILSDFYKKHFVDLRVLDTSCEPTRVPPPKIERGFIQEYLTTENVLLPGQHYHEVVYNCDPGYKLADSSLGHMFCQQQGKMLFLQVTIGFISVHVGPNHLLL